MPDARFDHAIGRYVHLDLDGVSHRVYFEESGSGIPLLLQHTAGADGTAVASRARRRRTAQTVSNGRVRPAVSRQIGSANELNDGGATRTN